MSKRFIGIDLEGGIARVAVLTMAPGRDNVELDKRSYDSPEDAALMINEMIGEAVLTDRLITALPCRVGLFRRMRFPFREKGKIAAALPLELSSQLPVPLKEHLISFLPALARENDYEVDALVVNQLEVDDLLNHFPDPQQNPRRIDLFPFALLPALSGEEGILIYCRLLEVVVALVYDERIWDYRLLPGTSESSEDEILDFISNQVSQLENAIGREGLQLWVVGAGVSERILTELHGAGRTISMPAAEVFGDELSCEMAPAALLALSEQRLLKKGEQYNFRQGEFAAQGQLEIFRTKLIVAAIMLFLVLFGTATHMFVGYLQKTREEVMLQQQLAQLFKQVMPVNTPVVDVPLQVESKLQELQQQVQMFGLGGHGAATVIQALSKDIADDIKVDFLEFNYSNEKIRLNAVTDSFDAVNRITELIKADPLFESVEISNAKLGTEGKQVDFELQLKLYGGGGEQ